MTRPLHFSKRTRTSERSRQTCDHFELILTTAKRDSQKEVGIESSVLIGSSIAQFH
jgi:hypothetical protein